jgi:hypothetical protein
MLKLELPTVTLARALASVESVAYKKDDDPSIFGVLVRVIKLRDGACEIAFVATNRLSAARFVCEAEYADPDFRVTLPLPFVRKVLAVIGDASEGSSEIVRDDRQLKAKFYGVGALEYMIDGAEVPFPSVVEALWPTDAPLARDEIGLDPARAVPIGKAFKNAGSEGADLRFELRGPTRPIVVTSESSPELSVLLMPCVTDDEKAEAARQLEMFPAASIEKGVDERVRGGLTLGAIDRAIDDAVSRLDTTPAQAMAERVAEMIVPKAERLRRNADAAVRLARATVAKKPAPKKSDKPKRSHHKKK